jgi:hypothetical protein
MGMRSTLLRILKHGGVAAGVLAVAGYLLAEVGGVWLAAHPVGRLPDPGAADPVAADLRWRLPFGMAAWGFGLVAMFELLGWLIRGTPPPPLAKPADPAEKLWADLERHVDPPTK